MASTDRFGKIMGGCFAGEGGVVVAAAAIPGGVVGAVATGPSPNRCRNILAYVNFLEFKYSGRGL